MANTNEHTGARLTTKPPTKEYEEGWDRIFGTKLEETEAVREAQCGHWVNEEKVHD